MPTDFYSHGKLLLSGEYLILDGATGLAIPTSYGQRMQIHPTDHPELTWISRDEKGQIWFQTSFSLEELRKGLEEPFSPGEVQTNLKQILRKLTLLKPEWLAGDMGYHIETQLEFPRSWGLGSSSTLLANLAKWTNINPYTLLGHTFGGSGYDLACAHSEQPIFYTRHKQEAQIEPVSFLPPFHRDLFFIHLNRKQDSRQGIADYRKKNSNKPEHIGRISEISREMTHTSELDQFNILIDEHENLLAEILEIPPIKTQLFPDFPGSIKSLGAWGGDFILATGKKSQMSYFSEAGYATIIPFEHMIL